MLFPCIIKANCMEGDFSMAKAGMRRPDPKEPHGTESNKRQNFPRNEVTPVPEIQGRAKTGNAKADKQHKP